MLRRITDQMGTAGLVVAMMALIVALAGSAFGASTSGGGKATASKKGKPTRGPKGPKGATGPIGPTGPAGPVGAKGDIGAAGANGSNGTSGAQGAPGKSTLVKAAALTKCEELGGIDVHVEGEPGKEVCNGKKGKEGPQGIEGKPWTPNNTLPLNATLTGTWSLNATNATPEVNIPISFPIQLSSGLDFAHVHTGSSPACTGTGALEPLAESGHLCVYTGVLSGATLEYIADPQLSGEGTGVAGAQLHFSITSPTATGSGTWAVTG